MNPQTTETDRPVADPLFDAARRSIATPDGRPAMNPGDRVHHKPTGRIGIVERRNTTTQSGGIVVHDVVTIARDGDAASFIDDAANFEPERVTVAGFTWTRDRSASAFDGKPPRDETWTLDDAVALIGCTWYCKNYGPAAYEGSSFSGWRCGSGGPWPTEYASREDAMRRVVPYLLERMRSRIVHARNELVRLERVHAAATAAHDAAKGGDR